MNNDLNLDLMLTYDCNFRCSYCYEKTCNYEKSEITNETIFNLKKYISWYLKKYSNKKVHLNFWGGEPTLKKDIIFDLIETYLGNDKILFHLFTNGYNIIPYIDIFQKCLDINEKKITTQISYDYFGQTNRVLKTGRQSKENILNTILLCKENQIPFEIKSTISLNDLDNVDLFYDEFCSLYPKYLNENQALCLTVDTEAKWNLSNEEFDQKINDLKDSLKRILKKVLFKKTSSNFNWLYFNKALCTAGKKFFCVDIDGKIYPCHGSVFSKFKEEHCLGNIEELRLFNFEFDTENDIKCKDCDVIFCYRCNAHCFERSQEKLYQDKWLDFSVSKKYCQIQKVISNFILAYNQIKEKEGVM